MVLRGVRKKGSGHRKYLTAEPLTLEGRGGRREGENANNGKPKINQITVTQVRAGEKCFGGVHANLNGGNLGKR